MRTPAVRIDDLLDAYEFASASAGMALDHGAYVCLATGTIHYRTDPDESEVSVPDDIDDPDKYLQVPDSIAFNLGRRVAIDFAEEALADDLDAVYDMFRRRGAYSRFKDLLDRRGKLQAWYDFEERQKKDALREWALENGLEVHD